MSMLFGIVYMFVLLGMIILQFVTTPSIPPTQRYEASYLGESNIIDIHNTLTERLNEVRQQNLNAIATLSQLNIQVDSLKAKIALLL